MCVGVSFRWLVYNDAPSIGVDICGGFSLTATSLYFKWESIVLAPNSIGTRYIDSTSISALRALIRSDLSKATLTQTIKVESGVRRARGAPMDMLLGGRLKLANVGLVDATPKLQSSSAIPRIGKIGASKIVFECHDMEDVSLDKRNCTCHNVLLRLLFS